MVEAIFEAVRNTWVCVSPESRAYYKPLRQNRYMAEGKPRREAKFDEEMWGNRIFLDGNTHWIKLPMIMFIGLCETYCVDRDEALMAVEAGGSRRDRHRFYDRNLKLFKEINEYAFSLSGKDKDYEGLKVWRRKLDLITTRIANNRPAQWVDTDVLYLKT